MFNALSVIKFAASAVVGVGTAKIVGKVIKDHVTPETLIDKVTVTAAAWVISGIATTATKKYVNETVDDIATTVTETIDNFKVDGKLGRINREESTFEQEGLSSNDFVLDIESDKWKRIVKVEHVPQ